MRSQHENNAHSYDYKTIYNHSYIIQLLVIIKSKMNTHSSILHLIKFNYMYNIIMEKFVLSMKKMQEFVEILPIRIRIRILYWPIKDPQSCLNLIPDISNHRSEVEHWLSELFFGSKIFHFNTLMCGDFKL
jgi:hypothetical protein